MRITILAMLLTAIIACQLPKSGDVRLAAGASAEKIDTRAEASKKKAEVGKARDITYNDYDPRMMGSALLAGLALMIVFIIMDGPKEPKIRLALGVLCVICLLGAIANVMLMGK